MILLMYIFYIFHLFIFISLCIRVGELSVKFWFVEPGLCGGEPGAGSAGVKHQPDPVSFIIHSAGSVQTCTSPVGNDVLIVGNISAPPRLFAVRGDHWRSYQQIKLREYETSHLALGIL